VTERGPIFDAAREAYEAAQALLTDLIDGPDKSAPFYVYRVRIDKAMREVQDAHRKMMEAWG